MGKITLMKQSDVLMPMHSEDVEALAKLPENSVHTVTIRRLSKDDQRSLDQNRLQFKWLNDLAKQGDQTVPECRAESKLLFGVPILRAADESFRDIYDRLIRPLVHEDKISLMAEPIDFPVTSRMDTETMTKYLKAMSDHYIQAGFQLTGLEHLTEWAKDGN